MRLTSKYTPEISQPFSTDTQSERDELKTLVETYRNRLETQWEDLKDNATHYGKQALIIGGSLLAAYLLLEALLPDEDKEESAHSQNNSEPVAVKKESGFSIGGALQSLAWTLALNWAQQKLSLYMQEELETNAPSQE